MPLDPNSYAARLALWKEYMEYFRGLFLNKQVPCPDCKEDNRTLFVYANNRGNTLLGRCQSNKHNDGKQRYWPVPEAFKRFFGPIPERFAHISHLRPTAPRAVASTSKGSSSTPAPSQRQLNNTACDKFDTTVVTQRQKNHASRSFDRQRLDELEIELAAARTKIAGLKAANAGQARTIENLSESIKSSHGSKRPAPVAEPTFSLAPSKKARRLDRQVAAGKEIVLLYDGFFGEKLGRVRKTVRALMGFKITPNVNQHTSTVYSFRINADDKNTFKQTMAANNYRFIDPRDESTCQNIVAPPEFVEECQQRLMPAICKRLVQDGQEHLQGIISEWTGTRLNDMAQSLSPMADFEDEDEDEDENF
ncbi:hypothetical protein GGH91_001411 [Coemansia sp. RSA 2671]|nr:hypothetical protein GGH91_001411 [Coemansia sp. RSA 2671]